MVVVLVGEEDGGSGAGAGRLERQAIEIKEVIE